MVEPILIQNQSQDNSHPWLDNNGVPVYGMDKCHWIFCGKDFIRRTSFQKYCSVECQKNGTRVSQWKHPEALLLKCRNEQCGKEFFPRFGRRYCSRACWRTKASNAARKPKNPIKKICGYPKCAMPFFTFKATRIYCSRSCGIRHRYSLNPELFKAQARRRRITYGREREVQYHIRTYTKPRNRIKRMLWAAKQRAKMHNLVFDESLYSLMSSPPTQCKCCGCILDYTCMKGMSTRRLSPSLDRVDNSIGYTLGNVQVICYKCNSRKSDSTIEELETIVRYMKSHSHSWITSN